MSDKDEEKNEPKETEFFFFDSPNTPNTENQSGDDEQPPPDKKHKKSGKKIGLTVFITILLIILVIVGTAFGIAYSMYMRIYDNSVDIVNGENSTEYLYDSLPEDAIETSESDPLDLESEYEGYKDVEPEDVSIVDVNRYRNDVINVLLVGKDSDSGDAGRSDSMMIASYNMKTRVVSLVSILRDTLVQIDGYGWDKLGHSFAYGRVGLTINTINSCYDMDITNYIVVNFNGLINIVNDLGGVEVYMTDNEAKYYNLNLHTDKFSQGYVTLTGEEALAHCRNRSLSGTDFERTRRQRDVIQAIYKKLSAESLDQIYNTIDIALGYVKTNIPFTTFSSIAANVFTANGISIKTTQVPFTGTWKYGKYERKSVLLIDFNENIRLLHEYIYG